MSWLPNYFNDIGFFVTLFGFLFTIWQIIALKSRQKAIETATNAAVSRLNTFDHAIRLSKSIATINNLKSSANRSHLPFIDQKIPELKEELDFCKNICLSQRANITILIATLNTIQLSLNEAIADKSTASNFDFALLFRTLDGIRDIFAVTIIQCRS